MATLTLKDKEHFRKKDTSISAHIGNEIFCFSFIIFLQEKDKTRRIS